MGSQDCYIEIVRKVYDNNTGDTITIERGEEGFGIRLHCDDKYARLDITMEDDLARSVAKAILDTINDKQ